MSEEITETPTKPETPTLSPIVALYEDLTSVDNSTPIVRQCDRIEERLKAADENKDADEIKACRTDLNKLLDEAKAARMKLQRAIKKHPVGAFAFNKSAIEKRIEGAVSYCKSRLDALTTSPTLAAEKPDTWVCFITARLSEINALAVECNQRGWQFENRGPAYPAPIATPSDAEIEKALAADKDFDPLA